MMAAVSGIGAWYPEQVRKNDAWPEDFTERSLKGDRTFNDIWESDDEASKITKAHLTREQTDPFLGAVERRYADESISAVDAEVLASERALKDAGLLPSDIDVVISYSVVPDRVTPASAPSVATRLGATRAQAYGVDAACASALVQIQMASALVASGQARHVLLTQSHLLLRTFPLLHPACPGLGDAATAVCVSQSGRWPILGTWGQTHGEFAPAVTWVREAGGSSDLPWWKAGSDFRVGSTDRQGAKVLQRDTVMFGVSTIREVCQRAQVDVERIQLLASVEPRGWVPSAISQVLGLDAEVAWSVYRTRGHLGASGPIANLEDAYRHQRAEKSGLIALYAQGAGFTRMGILLSMDETSATR